MPSFISALLGIVGIILLDISVRSDKFTSEKFRHCWSFYVACLSVGLSTFVNIPVVYLLRLQPTMSATTLNDYPGDVMSDVHQYILPHDEPLYEYNNNKQYRYNDIHYVEWISCCAKRKILKDFLLIIFGMFWVVNTVFKQYFSFLEKRLTLKSELKVFFT